MSQPATTISDILAAQDWARIIAEAEHHLQVIAGLDKREVVRYQTSLVTRENVRELLELTPFSFPVPVSGPTYIGEEPQP